MRRLARALRPWATPGVPLAFAVGAMVNHYVGQSRTLGVPNALAVVLYVLASAVLMYALWTLWGFRRLNRALRETPGRCAELEAALSAARALIDAEADNATEAALNADRAAAVIDHALDDAPAMGYNKEQVGSRLRRRYRDTPEATGKEP